MAKYCLPRLKEMKCMNFVFATGVSVPKGLQANTVKAHISHAHHHHVKMEAPVTKALISATHATACQVELTFCEIFSLFYGKHKSLL